MVVTAPVQVRMPDAAPDRFPESASGKPPLVVITTNEERTLPDAFIRRCLVLHLDLPKEPDKLIAKLVERGKTHFGDKTTAAVLKKAAELLAQDRAEAVQRHWRPSIYDRCLP